MDKQSETHISLSNHHQISEPDTRRARTGGGPVVKNIETVTPVWRHDKPRHKDRTKERETTTTRRSITFLNTGRPESHESGGESQTGDSTSKIQPPKRCTPQRKPRLKRAKKWGSGKHLWWHPGLTLQERPSLVHPATKDGTTLKNKRIGKLEKKGSVQRSSRLRFKTVIHGKLCKTHKLGVQTPHHRNWVC